MTRLIFLPDENNLLLLQTEQSVIEVLGDLSTGRWHPPGSDAPLGPLHALRLGRSLVLISALPLETTGGEAPAPVLAGGLPLSPRQRQVLQCLAQGLTVRQTAARLGLTERTAAFHVAALKRRLGAQTLAESVSRAAHLLDEANPGNFGGKDPDGEPG